MLIAYITVGVLLFGLVLAGIRWGERDVHRTAVIAAREQLRPLVLRLPLALTASMLLAALLPAEYVARVFGDAAGVPGVAVASVTGALLPGGPMVAFPLAVALFEAGAGTAQMIALITAWAVLALHRMVAFEIPVAGATFAFGRLAATLVLPFVAGLLALGVLNFV